MLNQLNNFDKYIKDKPFNIMNELRKKINEDVFKHNKNKKVSVKDNNGQEYILKTDIFMDYHKNTRKVTHSYDTAFKIGGQPVKTGTVVFLKQSSKISNKYNSTLANLVKGGHRFVVNTWYGNKPNTIAVSLLSTCEFLNKEKQLRL